MSNRRRKRKSEPKTEAANPQLPVPPSTDDAKAKSPIAEAKPKTEPMNSLLPKIPTLSRILSVVMLILGIIAVGALFYKVMASFFVPLFLAALLVVIFRPVHQWIYHRVGNRIRLASLATTSLILMAVLLPVILVISVATSQFTSMVSHVNFENLTQALDRAREQFGIALQHPEQFRRLDELTDSLDAPAGSEASISHQQVIDNIDEALALVRFLQAEVPGPPTADLKAATAEESLNEFKAAVLDHSQDSTDELIGKLKTEELFHRQSVAAPAAIRLWMREKLGGTFRSQVRLLANPSAEDFKKLIGRGREALQPRFVSVTSATGSYLLQILIGLIVMIFALYFFLNDGSAMIHTLMRLSPLDDNYEERLLLEFDRTSRAVVLASVLSALVQGMLAALAFWYFGFNSVILLFLITSLMALVPFLGAASVWIPCAIYLGAVDQNWWDAFWLAVYGATVVSSIDNLIKMKVLHGHSALHPLFALLSVLGGVKVFGPIGILIGPMVVVFLQTLLEILNHELEGRNSSDMDTSKEIPTDKEEPAPSLIASSQ
jgi:predicted PurR-regulated permease PerM